MFSDGQDGVSKLEISLPEADKVDDGPSAKSRAQKESVGNILFYMRYALCALR